MRGLETEQAVLAEGAGRDRAAAVAYYVALKAHTEGRYADALLWYRASMDTGSGSTPEYSLAFEQLMKWHRAKVGVQRMVSEKL